MTDKMRSYWHLAIPLAIAGGGLILHRGILRTTILGLDSYTLILTSRIRSFPEFIGTFTETRMDGRLSYADFYRPVDNLFLSMDYAFWGIEPFGYQLTSLLVWCSTIVALYLLMWRMLGPRSWIGPAIAALFYALHPSALSVIPVLARRPEMLVILFTALALSVLPRTPSRGAWKNYLIAGLLTLLAVGSKETGVLTVGLIFIHQASSLDAGGVRERISCGLWASLPAAALTAGLIIVRHLAIGGFGGYHAASQQAFTAKLTEFAPEYFFAMLCSGYFDTPSSRVLVTTLSVVAIATVSLGLVWTSRNKNDEALRRLPPILLLAASWLGATVLLSCMTTHFSPRHVLPMVFFVAMMLGALGEGIAAISRHKDWTTRSLAIVAGSVLLLVAIGALHGSPLVTRHPEMGQATRYQTQALSSLKEKIDSEPAGEVIDVDFRHKVPVHAKAVDDAWMISPWGLEAWLEIVYPERRFTVQPLRRQGMPIQDFWSVRLRQHRSPMK
ncbi:MAG: hypothetical protein JRS35_24660 [Deltaproteobacteria bacterium]|nr:hypothetical protein [Deltaproteobacteria bacterium]